MKIFKKNVATLKSWRWWLWPLFFFSFALFLRLWQNTTSPPSLYWEEVALGYDAYSVLKTGADRLGNSWPIVAFPSFGDYKPSLYYYALLPSIQFFGLSAVAVRLPAAVFSAATVAVVYWWTRRWFRQSVACWSALLLSVQPWSWQVGRAGFEVNLGVFMLVSGLFLLTLALDHWEQKMTKKFWWLSLCSAALLALSMYAYHGMRLLSPLMAGALVLTTLFMKKYFHWRYWIQWIPSLLVAIVVTIPIITVISQPMVQQRFAETSLFTLPDPVLTSNQWQSWAGSSWLAKIMFHRYWFWIELWWKSYWSHFSPTFLFGFAEENPRHLSGYLGALYPWELLTLIAGASAVRKKSRQRLGWAFLLILTLMAPLAASITKTTPHALRSLPLSAFLAIWSGIGVTSLLSMFKSWWPSWLSAAKRRYILPGTMLGVVLTSAAVLWLYLRWQYPARYSSEWQYGYQQLYQQLSQEAEDSEMIYVSRQQGRPAMYLFFTLQVDPRLVQAQAADPNTPTDQLELLRFGRWQFETAPEKPGIHAVSPAELPENVDPLFSINNLKQEPVWIVYRQS